MNYYADNSVCEWQSGLAAILCVVLAIPCWGICANLSLQFGEAINWPMTFGVFGTFGIPILGVVGNGWRAR